VGAETWAEVRGDWPGYQRVEGKPGFIPSSVLVVTGRGVVRPMSLDEVVARGESESKADDVWTVAVRP
jgi:hypothetical protein